MMNLDVVHTLVRHGYEMPNILDAIKIAEIAGSAELYGWVIRYNKHGKMIAVHPSYCGIYIGDFKSQVIFEKKLSYAYGECGFMNALYRDLPTVLDKLDAVKTNGYILCECCACDYPRRKAQVEKLGYTVHHSNISACKSDTSSCFFLIA